MRDLNLTLCHKKRIDDWKKQERTSFQAKILKTRDVLIKKIRELISMHIHIKCIVNFLHNYENYWNFEDNQKIAENQRGEENLNSSVIFLKCSD